MPTNWKQFKMIEQKNKERILAICPEITENSGIYVFQRRENDITYAYIGQAVNLLQRTAQHLSGFQHIDLSLKKRGLYDAVNNPTGWALAVYECASLELNDKEQKFIKEWAQFAQLYNHTTGSQGEGKRALGEAKSPKGYRDGVKQGERNVIKKIAHWFDLYLDANIQVGKADHARAQKSLADFYQLLQGDSDNVE